jgi:hypothetical protein
MHEEYIHVMTRRVHIRDESQCTVFHSTEAYASRVYEQYDDTRLPKATVQA